MAKSVPDFLEYLWMQLSDCFGSIWTPFTRKLQCLKCEWVSYKESRDMLLKIYIPPGTGKRISLKDLLQYNFITTHSEPSLCGNCTTNTCQKSVWEQIPDLVCLEIIRVTERLIGSQQRKWSKNCVPISFPTSGIRLPGSRSIFRVIATCDHKGTVSGGHWVTRTCCKSDTWYETNDLKRRNTIVGAPGINDTSVVLLLLIAEHLLM